MSLVRDLQHVTVYRDPEGKWNGAFPEIVCVSNGDSSTSSGQALAVAFRQAPYPPTLPAGSRAHSHGDPLARGAIILSKDGGRTWDRASYQVLAEPLGGVEQISVSALSGGRGRADLLLAPYARLRPKQTAVSDPAGWLRPTCSDIWVRRSEDGGVTWQPPVPLIPSPLACARVHAPMLELPDGTLLSPHCGSPCVTGEKQHAQAVIRSHDGGHTWGDGSIIAVDPSGKVHYHQCSLVRMADGEIIAAMHSAERVTTADGRRALRAGVWLARSRDDGQTWSPLETIPAQISGAAHHLLGLRDGRLLCVWGNRHDPSIRAMVSEDRGKSWSDGRGAVLQQDDHQADAGQAVTVHAYNDTVTDGMNTDIGEPCSAQLPDGRIITVYYWARRGEPLRYIEAAIYRV
jgi:hypothetical protein